MLASDCSITISVNSFFSRVQAVVARFWKCVGWCRAFPDVPGRARPRYLEKCEGQPVSDPQRASVFALLRGQAYEVLENQDAALTWCAGRRAPGLLADFARVEGLNSQYVPDLISIVPTAAECHT